MMSAGDGRWRLLAQPLGEQRHDIVLAPAVAEPGAQVAALGAAGLAERRLRLTVYARGEQFGVFAPQGAALVREIDPIAHAGEGTAEGGRLTAPMPGKLVAFLVKPGEAVQRGQPLAVMEAMKMEHTISAPRDGVVTELLYGVGDQVGEGGELLRLGEAATA
jgi:3-methylcrotonyl-CoA carboxylase alpha subunit